MGKHERFPWARVRLAKPSSQPDNTDSPIPHHVVDAMYGAWQPMHRSKTDHTFNAMHGTCVGCTCGAYLCPEAVNFVSNQGVHAHDAPAALTIHQASLPVGLGAALLQALLQRPVPHPRQARPLLSTLHGTCLT